MLEYALLLLILILLALVILDRSSSRGALGRFETLLTQVKDATERTEHLLRDELSRAREEAANNARIAREETNATLKSNADSLLLRMSEIATLQKQQLDLVTQQLAALTQNNDVKLDRMRETIESRLTLMQEDNSKKLERMRETVDEKLHATLEQRLSESFRSVSERLEQVHKGLGEMQTLASGVGDLKKVLTNIKTRGTWGEIQLGTLLDQVMTPEQYARNVVTKQGTNDRVEYAIRLPGRDGDSDRPVWLPIDAKFPQEDYQKLVEAQEQANPAMVDEAGRLLELRIKGEARSIREKYLDPPNTTDFGIMFLPIEGLYAEVIRRAGLCETLQREFRVVVTGPTTLFALLNSLQLGFRTLVIEKRSSEVWRLLGAIKTEFGRFGEVLERTQKKLQEASTTIETASTRSRAIERKLKSVQELPAQDAERMIGPAEPEPEGEEHT
jgi:DNA recombination protein RmuC